MPETIARIASFLLAGAFAWASVAKLSDLGAWRNVLGGYGIPERARPPLVIGVPLFELAIAVVIVLVSVEIGAVLSVIALAAFSLAILRARSLNGDRLPCGCFGASNVRDYKTMMLRNAFLGLLAALVLVSDATAVRPSLPGAGETVPAALALGGIALIAWVARQTSVSLRRREHN
jgi:hypothetical protein